ncbi:MAG: DUF3253 domain-containing protein [Opitutales bacterium]
MAYSLEEEQRSIRSKTIDLLNLRGRGKTICPSEVARYLFDESAWREKMPLVREVAAKLVDQGLIEICQQGRKVDIERAKGPIWLRLSAPDYAPDYAPD